MEPKTFRYMLLIAIMVELSVIDCYTQNVYDIDVLSGILLEGILLFITTKIGYQISVTDHLVGLLVGFSVPYLIAVLTKSLGLGDVGVYSLCSLTLGLNYSIYLIGLSFVLAGIFTISASAMRGRLLRGAIPFVPFISVATFLIMMSEFKLLNIYIYTVKSLI
jgi:prepilin signal peptidase PulO-like enzyme (type II secretory pathway)